MPGSHDLEANFTNLTIKVSYNRCKDIHKFGNKYLPSAYKTQVDFRSHFSGKSASYSPRNTVLGNEYLN